VIYHIERLIAQYGKCIAYYKAVPAFSSIEAFDCHLGICHVSYKIVRHNMDFLEHIELKKRIMSDFNLSDTDYAWECPYFRNSYNGNLDCLTERLNYLKQLLHEVSIHPPLPDSMQ